MDGHKDVAVFVLQPTAAHGGYLHRLIKNGAGGHGSQRNDDMRRHLFDFLLKPPAAGFYVAGRRALVEASLAALDVAKMFNGVGDVAPFALDADFGETGVEDLARRTDQRAPFDILLVAGLLGDKENSGPDRAFPKTVCVASL